MKNSVIIIVLILVFIGGFLFFYQSRPLAQKTPNTTEIVTSSQKWETKTDEQANVTVVVTPLDLSSQSSQWKFDIGMNTHSVKLGEDMIKSAVLIDDQGKEYAPVNWNGPVGGHHREGVLSFNAITPVPKSVNLKISGIGSVVRTFSWKLQ